MIIRTNLQAQEKVYVSLFSTFNRLLCRELSIDDLLFNTKVHSLLISAYFVVVYTRMQLCRSPEALDKKRYINQDSTIAFSFHSPDSSCLNHIVSIVDNMASAP